MQNAIKRLKINWHAERGIKRLEINWHAKRVLTLGNKLTCRTRHKISDRKYLRCASTFSNYWICHNWGFLRISKILFWSLLFPAVGAGRKVDDKVQQIREAWTLVWEFGFQEFNFPFQKQNWFKIQFCIQIEFKTLLKINFL